MSGQGAAFFDLDKTLMSGSSGMQFARVAARQGIVSRRQLASWGWDHLRYRLRGATDEETADVLKVARELITGVPEKTISRMGPEVMGAILPRVYPQMLDEVHSHQDAGRPAFIVSAAGNDIVSSLAAVLQMDGGIGTRYEVDGEGRFTGRLEGPFVYGPGKVEAMQRFAASTDRPRRLLRVLGLALDLPMLRARWIRSWSTRPDPAESAREEGWRRCASSARPRLVALGSPCSRGAGMGPRSRAVSRPPAPRAPRSRRASSRRYATH
jgi:HAD superfamily hydrolase (TIGR01490 family)